MHGLMREGRESQPCLGYLGTANRKGRQTAKPRLPRWATCSLLYHQKRNLAEYEGFLDVEESAITELCALVSDLIADVAKLLG